MFFNIVVGADPALSIHTIVNQIAARPRLTPSGITKRVDAIKVDPLQPAIPPVTPRYPATPGAARIPSVTPTYKAYGFVEGITGRALAGQGFTVSRLGRGNYRINFNPVTNPELLTILISARSPNTGRTAHVANLTSSSFDVQVYDIAIQLQDANFDFIIIQ